MGVTFVFRRREKRKGFFQKLGSGFVGEGGFFFFKGDSGGLFDGGRGCSRIERRGGCG